MGFIVSDLVVESIIRDGLEAVRRDSSIIDDVFEQLSNLSPLMNKKYGEKEINKIKTFFETKEVHIVQAFSQVVSSMPCISIQLVDNTESEKYAHLDDFEDDVQETLTDPEELAELQIVYPVDISSYDETSGTVYIDDSIDLSSVHAHHILEDVDGTEHEILGGIDNTTGQKQLLITPFSELSIVGPATIKSSINFKQYEKRGNIEDERLLLGIHTEERLLTIYLYILVKYFIESRKKDLINRGFQLATYSGSDFTRNLDYASDVIYSRYLTLKGIIQNNWISDKVIPIDIIDVQTLVDKDKVGNEEFPNATVQVDEEG